MMDNSRHWHNICSIGIFRETYKTNYRYKATNHRAKAQQQENFAAI